MAGTSPAMTNLYAVARGSSHQLISLRQRQDVALIRRHAAAQRIEIDSLHRRLSAAFDHLDPSLQLRGKTGPGAAESRIDAARSPFPGTLANLVGCKEPCGVGAGHIGVFAGSALVRQSDASAVFEPIAEMPMQLGAQFAVACHVDKGDRQVGWQ